MNPVLVTPTQVKNVNLKNDFAENFLTACASSNYRDCRNAMNEIIKNLTPKESPLAMFDIDEPDRPIKFDTTNWKCTTDVAYIGWLLSTYSKNVRKTTAGSKVVVQFQTGEKVAFYNLRNFGEGPITSNNILTDGDMYLACTVLLNSMVDSMREKGIAGMHPLSRVTFSEDGLEKLVEYLGMRDINEAVKYANVACVRKSHQLYEITNYYDPCISLAVLIGNMYAKKQSDKTREIGQRMIQKIIRASPVNINEERIIDVLNCMSFNTEGFDAERLMDDFKKHKDTPRYNRPKMDPVIHGATTAHEDPEHEEIRGDLALSQKPSKQPISIGKKFKEFVPGVPYAGELPVNQPIVAPYVPHQQQQLVPTQQQNMPYYQFQPGFQPNMQFMNVPQPFGQYSFAQPQNQQGPNRPDGDVDDNKDNDKESVVGFTQ